MIPRLVVVCELEAAPVVRIEADSEEDAEAVLAYADRLDLAAVGVVAAAHVAALRERRAA